jgi:hypothetical protein
MGKGMEYLILIQIRHEIEDVSSNALNVFMSCLCDVVHRYVEFALVVWEISGNLFAEKTPVQVRDLQASVNGIMVGNGDQVHTSGFSNMIEMERIGEALRTVQFFQYPFGWSHGKLRMNMEICFHDLVLLSFCRCRTLGSFYEY